MAIKRKLFFVAFGELLPDFVSARLRSEINYDLESTWEYSMDPVRIVNKHNQSASFSFPV